jgi:hypothetical protein
MVPKDVHSAILTSRVGSYRCRLRQHTLLPLDDCLYSLQPIISHLTHLTLHRCLARHASAAYSSSGKTSHPSNALPPMQSATSISTWPKSVPRKAGYVSSSLPTVPANLPLSAFVESTGKMEAADFLRDLVQAVGPSPAARSGRRRAAWPGRLREHGTVFRHAMTSCIVFWVTQQGDGPALDSGRPSGRPESLPAYDGDGSYLLYADCSCPWERATCRRGSRPVPLSHLQPPGTGQRRTGAGEPFKVWPRTGPDSEVQNGDTAFDAVLDLVRSGEVFQCRRAGAGGLPPALNAEVGRLKAGEPRPLRRLQAGPGRERSRARSHSTACLSP